MKSQHADPINGRECNVPSILMMLRLWGYYAVQHAKVSTAKT